MKIFRFWKPVFCLVLGAVLGFIYPSDKERGEQPKSTGPTTASTGVPSKDDFWHWKDDNAPLPKAFQPKVKNPRLTLPKEQRAAIVFDMNELMSAEDYAAILESLVAEDPEFLFSQAVGQKTYPAVVAMQCLFAKHKDFEKAVGKLSELARMEFWQPRLGVFMEELSLRGDIGDGKGTGRVAPKSPAIKEFMANVDLTLPAMKRWVGSFIGMSAEVDLPGTLAYVQQHPSLAVVSESITKVWVNKNPDEALTWIKTFTPAPSNLATIKLVAETMIQKSDPAITGQLIQSLQTLVDPEIRQKALEHSLGLASLNSTTKPEMLIEGVASLAPSPKKDYLAVDLATKLRSAGHIENNWADWLKRLNVVVPAERTAHLNKPLGK